MRCPECTATLTGRQETCSGRCRVRQHRSRQRERLERAVGYLDAAAADPASAAALARRARAALAA